MKKYHILYFILFTSIMVNAQTPANPFIVLADMPQSDFFSLSNKTALENMPLIVGQERFFNNDSIFRKGELVTKKRHYTTELGYRFDQIERALEVRFESGKQLYIEEKNIVLFKLYFDDQMVVFIPVLLPKGVKKTLTQVIYKTPTMQLYRDVHKTAERIVKNWRTADYYDMVKNDYHYYFRKNDNDTLIEVEMKPKSFVKLFPHKENLIKRLFDQEQRNGKLTVSKICNILKELEDNGNDE